MIWAGIWADGATKLAFVEGTQTADDYVYTLSEYLLPAAHRRFGTAFVFQQDNASIHMARYTKGMGGRKEIFGQCIDVIVSSFCGRRIPQKPCTWNEKAVHQGHSEQGEDNQILVSAVGCIFGSILMKAIYVSLSASDRNRTNSHRMSFAWVSRNYYGLASFFSSPRKACSQL
jgi:hypothetical protein